MENMTLTAGSSNELSEYQQPPIGEHKAVLVDIVLSKNEQTLYGIKDLLFFYFEIEAKMDDGRPFRVRKKFTHSLNEKSNLYKFLTKWRGKPFTAGEEFDLNTLIGVGCTLELESFTPEGETKVIVYVDRARRLAKKDWIKASGEYDGEKVRESIEKYKDTPPAEVAVPESKASPKAAKKAEAKKDDYDPEDDVPF